MKSKLLLGAGWGLVLLLVVHGLYLQDRQRDLARTADTLRAESGDRSRKLEAVKRELEKSATLPPSPALRPGPSLSAPAEKAPSAFELGRQLVAADPALQTMVSDYFRAVVSRQHALFYRRMQWSPDQIRRFEEIVSSGLVRNFPVGSSGQLPLSLPEVRPPAEVEAQLRAEFGEAFSHTLAEFQKTGQLDEVALRLNADLFNTDVALSPAQLTQFGEVMKAAHPGYMSGQKFDRLGVNWAQVLEASRPMMTASQLAAVERLARESQYQAAVSAATRAANQKGRMSRP